MEMLLIKYDKDSVKKILEKKVKPDFTVGEFLGEGMTSIVFEGFDKNGLRVAIKFLKKPTSYNEEIVLNSIGQLIKKIDQKIWIIKFCGQSLQRYIWNPKDDDDEDIKKVLKDPKKLLEIGLKAIYDLHEKGWLHTDIKPDNICVKKDMKGNVIFELIDFGNAQKVSQYGELKDASDFLKLSKYKKINKGKSFYQMYKNKIPYQEYKDPIQGNAVWSLRKSMLKPFSEFIFGDDIESLVLSLAYIFDYKNCTVAKLYNEYKTSREKIKDKLLKIRLYPEKCSVQIYKDAIAEIRKNMNITVPEICQTLNLDCKIGILNKELPKKKIDDSPLISSHSKQKRVSKKVSKKIIDDSPLVSSPKPKRVSKKVSKKIIDDSPLVSSPKPKRVSRKVSRKIKDDSPLVSSPKSKRVSKKVSKKIIDDSPLVSSPKPKRVSRKVSKKIIDDSPLVSSPKPKRVSKKVSKKIIDDSPLVSSPKTKRVSKKVSKKIIDDSPLVSSPKPKRVSKKVSRKIIEESYDNGFILNDKKIMYISDPISFYYLRPKKKTYDDGNGKYFPLIILCGDAHRSYKNFCVDCDCSISDKKDDKCCYKLSGQDFIKLIDKEVASKYPIDFYTETFFEGTGQGFVGGFMENLTTGFMVNCYNKELRSKCPAKNIRWQAGDIRVSGKSYFDIFQGKSPSRLDKDLIKSEKYTKNSYIEFQLYFLFLLLRHGLIKDFNEFLPKTVFHDVTFFVNFLLSFFDDHRYKLNSDKFSQCFFSLINKDNSAIYKQILKQNFKGC
jgi:serine/threonine protein kinase